MWSTYTLTSLILQVCNNNIYFLLLIFFKKHNQLASKTYKNYCRSYSTHGAGEIFENKDFSYVLLVKKEEIP